MAGAMHVIESAGAPALGDLREAGPDDVVYIFRDATTRADWSRYWDAIGVAFARGAQLSIIRREGE